MKGYQKEFLKKQKDDLYKKSVDKYQAYMAIEAEKLRITKEREGVTITVNGNNTIIDISVSSGQWNQGTQEIIKVISRELEKEVYIQMNEILMNNQLNIEKDCWGMV